MKARLIWSILLIAALLLGAGMMIWLGRPRSVEAVRARVGPVVELVYATGFVEAEQPVAVAARITAPVVAVLVREGEPVRNGQALVILQDDEQRGMLAQAAADRAAASLEERRTLELFRRGWVTKAARDRAVTAAAAARAAERSAAARLDQLVLRSRTDGVVLKRDVEPGDLAAPARTLLLLGDPAHIRVTATVDERDVARVRPGQAALMSSDAWPGRIIRGHVREVTPGGDPTQRAFRVRLALDERQTLPMGLTLEVNIVTREREKAVLVPRSAVASGQVVLLDGGRAHRRRVVIGIEGAEESEIVSGLAGNQLLLRDASKPVAEGERVRIASP